MFFMCLVNWVLVYFVTILLHCLIRRYLYCYSLLSNEWLLLVCGTYSHNTSRYVE